MKLFVFALLPALAGAAILPETVGSFARGAVSKPVPNEMGIWQELGLKASEASVYTSGKSKFRAAVWQLQDTTAGLAAFEWQRPADARPSSLGKYAAETKDRLVILHGNFLFSFEGYKPAKAEWDTLAGALQNVDGTSFPVLATYLPATGRVANSERYVLGPLALARFAPQIPPSVAGFRMGAEAQIGVFHSPEGDLSLAVFSYPTPQIAMDRVLEFQKLPGALVKRSGPLVAVTVAPSNPDFAERVLGEVHYQAEITRGEYVPTRRDNIGELILNVFVLIGLLLAFAVVSGLAVGGVRAFLRRGKPGSEADAMITLHLENR
jgi:hypothetical protein